MKMLIALSLLFATATNADTLQLVQGSVVADNEPTLSTEDAYWLVGFYHGFFTVYKLEQVASALEIATCVADYPYEQFKIDASNALNGAPAMSIDRVLFDLLRDSCGVETLGPKFDDALTGVNTLESGDANANNQHSLD
jgi:hypothetical protein